MHVLDTMLIPNANIITSIFHKRDCWPCAASQAALSSAFFPLCMLSVCCEIVLVLMLLVVPFFAYPRLACILLRHFSIYIYDIDVTRYYLNSYLSCTFRSSLLLAISLSSPLRPSPQSSSYYVPISHYSLQLLSDAGIFAFNFIRPHILDFRYSFWQVEYLYVFPHSLTFSGWLAFFIAPGPVAVVNII